MKALACLLTLVTCLLAISGCNHETAPDGSSMVPEPTSVDLGSIGVQGDRTFVPIFVNIYDADGNPLDQVDVVVSSFFLEFLDSDGNYTIGPASIRSDSRGQVSVMVEAPLAPAGGYTDTISFISGAATASVEISASPADDS